MKDLRLALIYGGISEEREISLISGEKVAEALRDRFDLKVYNPKTDLDRLAKEKDEIDIGFPILHGKYGEDGTIQGFLELLEIPFVGSGVLASAIDINKLVFKQLIKNANLPFPRTQICDDRRKVKVPRFGPAWFVKPNTQGSSVGVSSAGNIRELKSSLKEAFEYDSIVHIEERIEGREMTCGVMEKDQQPFSLPVVEIIPQEEFFNYRAKYNGSTQEIVPARIDQGLTKKIQDLALKVFQLVGGSDFARIDFMVDQRNKPYILEINTIPGLTDESLLPKEAQAAGYPFPEFLSVIIDNAWQRTNMEEENILEKAGDRSEKALSAP